MAVQLLTSGHAPPYQLLQDVSDSVVFMLSEVHRDWSAIGRSLVRFFLAKDKVGDDFL